MSEAEAGEKGKGKMKVQGGGGTSSSECLLFFSYFFDELSILSRVVNSIS